MIKKICLLLAAALAAFLLAAPAQAQSTRAQLNATYLNPCIFANVTGLISEACVYTLHANEIQSFGTLADTNAWTGLNTFADNGSWSSSGIGNAKALGVGETAPSAGNVNIAGQYQIGGSPLNFSNLAGNVTTSQGGLYGATLNAIPYGGGAGTLPIFAPITLNAAAFAVGAWGNGVVDDGPMLRAAYAACVNGNFHSVFLPAPSVQYTVKTLDVSGQGGIVIGDGQKIAATVSITSGNNTLTSSTAVFTAAMVGASIDVPGAGSSGVTLTSTITSFNSSTSVTLANNAGTTLSLSAQTLQIGHSNTCGFEGEALNTGWNFNTGNTGTGWGVHIVLGTGLNRPLVFVATKAATPTFSNVILDGNGLSQTGWAQGPNGKLYTVQVDDGSPYPEGAINFDRALAINGYNGNVYVGSGRGSGAWHDFISLYGGQGSSDYCVLFNGFDMQWDGQSGVGSCNGNATLYAEGSQYWLNGVAFWLSITGLTINGGQVPYLSASNINIQDMQCHGLIENNTAPFGGTSAVGHFFSGITFDGNNQNNTVGCNDVEANGSNLLSLSNVGFLGNLSNSGHRPTYNVGGSGVGVQLSNVRFGSNPNSGGLPTTAFQIPAAIECANCQIENTWTPFVAGAGTAGTPSYTTQTGSWSRHNNEVTAHFNLSGSLSGASGSFTIGGLPFFSSSVANEVGSCNLHAYSAWTAQTGYTMLSGLVGNTSTTIYLYENGSGKSATQAQVGEFGTFQLQGVCIYHTDS